MPVPGPAFCRRGGLTPLFVVTNAPSPGSVAVAVTLSSLLYASAATRAAPWNRVLAVCIPVTGLALGHTDHDRAIAVPLAAVALWRLSGSRFKDALPALAAAAVGAVGVAAGAPCDSVVPVGSDCVALAVAVAGLLAAKRTVSAAQMWAAAEFAAVVVVLAADPAELGDREHHLTWQNVALLAVWLFARLRGAGAYVWLVAVLVNVAVVIGVWFMSGLKCGLLQIALDQVGPTGYFVGNFILHYYPSLRLLSAPPKQVVRPYRQVAVAVAVVVLYCATLDPKRIYDCPGWLESWLVLVSFVGLIGAASAALAWFGTWPFPGLW